MTVQEKLPVTVTVMTFNEASRIEKCLRSLSFASEVVIIDSGSKDNTQEIARSLGARVVEREWPGDFSNQRNFADTLAAFDWVLQIDADETVSPKMAEELSQFFSSPLCENHRAGRFPRKEIIFGRWVRHGGWYPQHKLRLYRKGAGKWVGTVHEKYVTHESVHTFSHPIVHDSYESIHVFIEKFNRYASIDAMEDVKKGRKFSLFRLFFRPLERFFGRYIVHKGYRDGMHGFVLAALIATSYFIRELKVWEITSCEKIEE